MNTKLLIIFICLNIVNVVVQTVKSLATIKCGKTIAAVVNAFAYGLQTIVTVYMLCELPLFWKAGIVAVCNLIGVYVVKFAEEKARKDKLWKVEATVNAECTYELREELKKENLSHNFIENIGPYAVFNIFCATQQESAKAKELLTKYNAKYFVSETKML